ncbi:MAG: hypothetical protein HLUCCO07_16105 [Rhodobacteraceae bacterium HLUCCO07]|nr:MAG: hypothetical protein HLUCCO07_16105 [Rhodobacteraceae bacterium HLUCCO07]
MGRGAAGLCRCRGQGFRLSPMWRRTARKAGALLLQQVREGVERGVQCRSGLAFWSRPRSASGAVANCRPRPSACTTRSTAPRIALRRITASCARTLSGNLIVPFVARRSRRPTRARDHVHRAAPSGTTKRASAPPLIRALAPSVALRFSPGGQRMCSVVTPAPASMATGAGGGPRADPLCLLAGRLRQPSAYIGLIY